MVHWYGQTEKVALAVDVDSNDMFRVYTSYGYPRIVNGELVSTSFVNKALPLINFMTGDGAEIIENDKHIYIKNLKSRRGKDFVYLDENKKIPTTSINLHLKKIKMNLQELKGKSLEDLRVISKLVQGMIDIRKSELVWEMKENLKDFKIEDIDFDDKIVKSHRGKKIFLVQELK